MTPPPGPIQAPLLVQDVEGWTVVEFKTQSLMDTMELERIAGAIYPLIDEQNKRLIILDFTAVQYLSSQAIGILLQINRKLTGVPRSQLVLCGVSDKLMQLLKITRLDRVLTIKATQREALKNVDRSLNQQHSRGGPSCKASVYWLCSWASR